eukprot:CAMPEP_0179300596 /NCGR_PEP_ID=MMETSP0797-20121207/47116_1 /TAXON_ID=47934 /ORGANISM="Dinophysis acuminata, Strain DAEP01" /LENGTH=66 /DNA_ID=CAMNT_0021010071 /DNA_START=12 /DNA_END=209 /DNA_ORIENTATION=-
MSRYGCSSQRPATCSSKRARAGINQTKKVKLARTPASMALNIRHTEEGGGGWPPSGGVITMLGRPR